MAIATVVTSLPAQAGELTDWQFDPTTRQLHVTVPSGTTPRYFLLAEPARIVLDLPNTDVGAVPEERSFSGAVREIRVGQFQPGLTRIVIELSPDAVFAPEQVELQQSSDTQQWVLRPILVDDPSGIDEAPRVATAPETPEPATSAMNIPQLMEVPQAIAPMENALSVPAPDSLPPLEDGAIELPIQPMLPTESLSQTEDATSARERSRNPNETSASEETDGVRVVEPSELNLRSERLLDATVPSVELGESLLDATQPTAEIIPLSERVNLPGSNNTPSLAEPETPPVPLVVNPPTPPVEEAIDSASIPDGEGAIAPPDLSTSNVTELPPANFLPQPNAVIQVPPIRESSASSISAPEVAFGDLPDDANTSPFPPPSGDWIAVNSDDIIPSGTVLRLRYPGQTPLTLSAGTPARQEVLLLDQDVYGAEGDLLLAKGSLVLGRFELSSSSGRFIVQAIATSGENYLLSGESNTFGMTSDSTLTIQPDQTFEVELDDDLFD
jgi:hypothetical protein